MLNENAVPDQLLLRRGLHVSATSIVWTLIASSVTVFIGLMEGSLVLTAFGVTGLLDAAGSTALVVHFRHGLKHDTFSEAHERVAFLIVTIGLVVVALATLAGSTHRLITGGESGRSVVGMIVASASVVVLSTLAVVKRQVGHALPSAALRADGALSFTGALLAVITVLGTLLTAVGLSWADPVAAIAVAVGALMVVVTLHRNNES